MSEIESLIKRLTDEDSGVSMGDCTRAAELLRELDALRMPAHADEVVSLIEERDSLRAALELASEQGRYALKVVVDLNKQLDALRKQEPVAQKVPDGFVLVPKEPTAEMTLAGVREAVSHPRPNVYQIYRAMLAAAQAQEADQ